VIFLTYSLYIGNILPYRESAGNALKVGGSLFFFFFLRFNF
jgi:hypothetical protein